MLQNAIEKQDKQKREASSDEEYIFQKVFSNDQI